MDRGLRFFGFLFMMFVVMSVVGTYLFKQFSDSYEEVFFDRHFKGEVVRVINTRGFVYLTLRTKEKYVLRNTRNYNYKQSQLFGFLESGDMIEKKKDSDSIIVSRNGRDYLFLLGKNIEEN